MKYLYCDVQTTHVLNDVISEISLNTRLSELLSIESVDLNVDVHKQKMIGSEEN